MNILNEIFMGNLAGFSLFFLACYMAGEEEKRISGGCA
jgi:hypothetical protein